MRAGRLDADLPGSVVSAADFLNADVAVVGQAARDGVRWWLGELAAIFAPSGFGRSRRSLQVWAERADGGAYIVSRADGTRTLHHAGARPLATALVLPADAALVRTFAAPPLSERDLRRMVELDLDRLTPFSPERAYFDVRRGEVGNDGEAASFSLAAAPRARADAELQAAEAAGLDVDALVVRDGETLFDLLPQVRGDGSASWTRSPAAKLWGLAAVLLVANLGVAIWKDVRFTDTLQAQAAAQQPVAERIRRLRRDTVAWRALEASQIAARDRQDPLRTLDALSRDLPDGAWATRLTLEGDRLHLVGQQTAGVDAMAALQHDPAFADVRVGDVGGAGGALAPLDLTATLTGKTAP